MSAEHSKHCICLECTAKEAVANAHNPSSLAATAGSASGAKLQKLFEDARKSPIYYLQALDIECGEALILLKANLNRTAYYNYEKQQYIKGQIQATRKHLREIRKVMCECEKIPKHKTDRLVRSSDWLNTIMKLDRNITNPRRGKYALVKLRNDSPVATGGGQYLTFKRESVDFGDTDATDFFVIRLKDKFAGPALRGYAKAITEFLGALPEQDPLRASLVEYHHEIIRLSEEAHRNPHQRIPD